MFVSEHITPEPGSFDPKLMSTGLAALPGAFTWRGRRYEVVECLEHHKQSGAEGHTAGGERYLRRQVFTVELDTGQRATLYIERQARGGGGAARQRWFLYTIEPGPAPMGG